MKQQSSRPRARPDAGFTLVETLVVMIIIGILAAIAIPVFLQQRAKAEDAVTKADVSKVGKELATYWVDGTIVPTVAITTGRYTLTPGSGVAEDVGAASLHVSVLTTDVQSPERWCLAFVNSTAYTAIWKYSARGGLGRGDCTAADIA